jgi:glyoxalase family protein
VTHPILGLHHVTSTVDEAQADLDFCLGVLGLRLVKKTVNFGNHHVYHFYYGDERGTPGTIWTTFPYRGMGVAAGSKGAGQIGATSFSVPASSLGFWRERLRERGLNVADAADRLGDQCIAFSDPAGLHVELIANDRDTRAPWEGGGVDLSVAIRGLHSVTLTVREPEPTIAFMCEVLGFTLTDEIAGRKRLSVAGGGPGRTIDVAYAPDLPDAKNGLGTVHHVAVAIADEDAHALLREDLVARGIKVTEIRDRQYFKSIYFREPGGVLIEVATVGPGFTVDEPHADLGRVLKLPPWEEKHRADIEQRLPLVQH